MNDYFDELEIGLRDAVRRRAHMPWHARLLQLSLSHRGLAVVVASLVVATPAVAAVGAASGWFSKGSSDIYYPASATSGLGKVLPKGGRLLPIRVADPAGGPAWGIRLVKTTRGETCIQVGRVVDGQIGALGIDGSWHDDHKFHEIKPNDQLADICGATDAAGNGFVNDDVHGAPASVDVPIYNGRGIPSPASAERMIEVGLLGPDATSITYKTPGGKLKTERTVGGVGAYLVVFRQTAANCHDFGGGTGCGNGGFGDPSLHGYTSVEKVTYRNGKTCSDVPWGRVCKPVGWVAPKASKLTAAAVAAPITVNTVRAKQLCSDEPPGEAYKGVLVPCDGGAPKGYWVWEDQPGNHAAEVLATISFTARAPVTSANSWYAWSLSSPGGCRGNSGTEGAQIDRNVRVGQRISWWMVELANCPGTYRGRVTFVQNAGQRGSQGGALLLRQGGVLVGRFSFQVH